MYGRSIAYSVNATLPPIDNNFPFQASGWIYKNMISHRGYKNIQPWIYKALDKQIKFHCYSKSDSNLYEIDGIPYGAAIFSCSV